MQPSERQPAPPEQKQLTKAYDAAYIFISYRPRSLREVNLRLSQKSFSDAVVATTIDRLIADGLLDDKRFAESWVTDRTLTGIGPKKLRMELAAKGVDRNIIDEALESVSQQDEIDAIVALVNAKRLLQRYPDQRKLISALMRRGYTYSDIATALKGLTTSWR